MLKQSILQKCVADIHFVLIMMYLAFDRSCLVFNHFFETFGSDLSTLFACFNPLFLIREKTCSEPRNGIKLTFLQIHLGLGSLGRTLVGIPLGTWLPGNCSWTKPKAQHILWHLLRQVEDWHRPQWTSPWGEAQCLPCKIVMQIKCHAIKLVCHRKCLGTLPAAWEMFSKWQLFGYYRCYCCYCLKQWEDN